jgi:hypothetical protein
VPEGPAPACERAAQLKALDGRRVRLIGIYRPVPTLKKMPRPGRPREEVELGEVVIELDGDASEYDSAAPQAAPARIALGGSVRPAEEIERFRDRRVAVEGRLALVGRGRPEAASVRPGPALVDPGEPRLAE